MKYSALAVSTILASAFARPEINTNARVHARDVHTQRGAYARPIWNAQLRRREVPQEHSHQKFVTVVKQSLDLNNPDGIVDPIFGLLGNAAGSAGQGSITNTDCLQQATADQAFTNAKAAGDIDGMTAALIYRALERNTAKVGLASVPCTAIEAINPEIAAVQQHQDPASAAAAEINTNIVINLAIQISCIGGDPALALQSGTFAPGDLNDRTAKGNTCDDQNDAQGCIFTQNLLVEDASIDDIMAAVSGATCGTGNAATNIIATETAATNVVSTVVSAATDLAVASAPLVAALPTECNTTPPANAAVTALPTANQGMGAALAMSQGMEPADVDQSMGAAPAPAMNTSPAPPAMNTALAPAAGNAAVDCSAQIASALAAAGFAGDASAWATAVTSVVVEPTPVATHPPATAAAGLDFGTCPNPTIVFGLGFDGRKEASFEPSDTTTFTHGSALNIKVITDFICQQLGTKCGANQAALDACAAGATAAQAAGAGKDQSSADTFNAALGF